jgi:hypothetical protein
MSSDKIILMAEIAPFLSRVQLLRLAHLSRRLHRLAEALNPWMRPPPHAAKWWAQVPDGSRIVLHGALRGKHVITSRLLIAGGSAHAGFSGPLICSGARCCAVVRGLHLRKVLALHGAACHLQGCRIRNPYGIGVAYYGSSGSITHNYIAGCREDAILLHACHPMTVAHNTIEACQAGVRCIGQSVVKIEHNLMAHLAHVAILIVAGLHSHIVGNYVHSSPRAIAIMGGGGKICGNRVENGTTEFGAGLSTAITQRNYLGGELWIGAHATPLLNQNHIMGVIHAHALSFPTLIGNAVRCPPCLAPGLAVANQLC